LHSGAPEQFHPTTQDDSADAYDPDTDAFAGLGSSSHSSGGLEAFANLSVSNKSYQETANAQQQRRIQQLEMELEQKEGMVQTMYARAVQVEEEKAEAGAVNEELQAENLQLKEELTRKLAEFAPIHDNLEEIMENREQIEISKFYERKKQQVH